MKLFKLLVDNGSSQRLNLMFGSEVRLQLVTMGAALQLLLGLASYNGTMMLVHVTLSSSCVLSPSLPPGKAHQSTLRDFCPVVNLQVS